MKILAKFLGRVNEFDSEPGFSYVTLKNVDTGEEIESNAVTKKLVEAGITKTGDEFEILIRGSVEGQISTSLRLLEPREVSEEQINSIVKEVDHKLGSEGAFEI